MSKKVAVPLMLLSLGIFAVTQTAGCGSSSNGGGTGGAKADGGTGGKGTGGTTADAGTGGRGTGGTTADAGTGGRGTGGTTADAGTGGMGTGGRVDGGTGGMGTGGVGTGGRIDAGGDVIGTGGMGTGGSTPDAAPDAPAIFDGPTAFDGPGDASPQSRAAVLCPSFPGGATSAANGSMEPSDFCAIFDALCGTTLDAGNCLARYTASRNTAVNASQPYGTIGTCESVHVCNVYNIMTDAGNATHCPHAAGLVLCLP
jgi:hypothetical protein